MTNLVDQYTALHGKQLLERAMVGGALSQEEEDAYVAQFEVLWNAMSAKEHAAIEDFLTYVPEAPADLLLVDVAAQEGVPRKKAER